MARKIKNFGANWLQKTSIRGSFRGAIWTVSLPATITVRETTPNDVPCRVWAAVSKSEVSELVLSMELLGMGHSWHLGHGGCTGYWGSCNEPIGIIRIFIN